MNFLEKEIFHHLIKTLKYGWSYVIGIKMELLTGKTTNISYSDLTKESEAKSRIDIY